MKTQADSIIPEIEKNDSNPQKNARKLQKPLTLSQKNNPIGKAFAELGDNVATEEKQAFRAFFFKGYDDYDIYVRVWDDVTEPKAVILIAHGMVEHGLRYDEFARFLNKNGYIVVVPDCRGHGRTAGAPDQVGVYDGDIFNDTVRDNIKLADMLRGYYDLPLVAMGHSYGSFITQNFIQNYHNHSAVVLIGSACFKGRLDHKLGKIVADITATCKGKSAPANMLYNMTFGAYAKSVPDGNWLTHDTEIVKEYDLDPYCGKICSAQFYRSFFGGLKRLYRPAGLNMIDKEVPVLITSGKLDPVAGKKHKMLDKLAPLYKKKGIKDVTYKLWDNGLHEILNETFKQDVFQYILDWLNQKLAK
ncbi:MAG: alpha/beta hydrolase [Clostridia bacterium]|nr:alpha/beta hydrolase [Clostridia bacterium]